MVIVSQRICLLLEFGSLKEQEVTDDDRLAACSQPICWMTRGTVDFINANKKKMAIEVINL